MADKKFGVKQINLIGASGTPTLTSPNNLNVNAINVAISTDLSVGGNISVPNGATVTRTTNTNQLVVSGISTLGASTVFTTVDNLGNIGIGTNRAINDYSGGNSVLSIHGRTWPGNPTVAGSGVLRIYSNQTLLGSIYGSDLTGAGLGRYFDIESFVPMSISCGTTISMIGTTEIQQLKVTGVSTFNDNVRVAGIVTANSLLISNDGGNNGSLFIQDTGSYSELTFRAANGTNQSKIQGVESNLYIYSGSAGHVSLGAYSIFYPNGNVILNNGNTGTTFTNQLSVSGVSTFQGYVGVGVTTDPVAYELDVAGSTRIRDGLIVNGGSTYPVELSADVFVYNQNIEISNGGLTSSGDVNVGVDTSTGVVLTSPNGTQYRLIVDDSGNLSTTLV